MNQQTENEQCWEELEKDCADVGTPNGSGIPIGFQFKRRVVQLFKDSDRIYIFPVSGTCICLNKEGTWGGDSAPFSD